MDKESALEIRFWEIVENRKYYTEEFGTGDWAIRADNIGKVLRVLVKEGFHK